MKPTDAELNAQQLFDGLSCFNKLLGSDILNKWCDYCLIKYCVTGSHIRRDKDGCVKGVMNERVVSNLGHRHDQSILSIRKARYRLPVVRKLPAIYEWKSLE